ncbi:MAG: GtrA family protein, partial [Lachnospiraceae bacterium]|nr:GtrA family protein [Lachnospiraceae bacterium]
MDKFIEEVVNSIFRILHIRLKEETKTAFIQFIKFGIVGVSNTLLSYLLNLLVLFLLKPYALSWDYFAANTIAFVISVAWSFYWNNRFVFTLDEGEERSIWKALAKTYISYSFTGLILANLMSWIWIDLLGISKVIAPLLNLIVSVPVNFLINKFWAFHAEKP